VVRDFSGGPGRGSTRQERNLQVKTRCSGEMLVLCTQLDLPRVGCICVIRINEEFSDVAEPYIKN